MVTYKGSISEALDEAIMAHDKAYTTISPEFKKKIKLAEKRIEKAEEEHNQIKKEAEKSMVPKLREKFFQVRKKFEKVMLDKDREKV